MKIIIMIEDQIIQFKSFEQKRIYQKVAEHLVELINTNELSVGQRLPPERELAKKIQVSRNVVREAFLALEIAGYIEIRVGVGTFVVSKTPQISNMGGIHNLDIGAGPIDILAARKTVEGEIAAISATTATHDDIHSLDQALVEILNDTKVEDTENDWPRIFHTRLASSTQNPIYISIVDLLWEQTRGPLFENFRKHTKMRENQNVSQDHRSKLINCLKQKDASGAKLAMHQHIDAVGDILTHLDMT